MTLRVTLSIVPFGVEEQERVIETLNISNLGQAKGGMLYQYGVELNKYKTKEYDLIVNHRREDGALQLVYRALHDYLYPEEGQN